MDPLSQLDVTAPDHVSVITREGKVTISVLKDGTSVTLGFPIREPWTDPWTKATPRPPLEQSPTEDHIRRTAKETGLAYLQNLAERDQVSTKVTKQFKPVGAPGTTHLRYQGPTPKLNPKLVREIKRLLNDEMYMNGWTSKTQAYKAIGRIYNVTGCAIGNIARGIAWSHITV